jgi:hypothetical protein
LHDRHVKELAKQEYKKKVESLPHMATRRYDKFTASKGWLFNFAKRNGLSSVRPRTAHRPSMTNLIRRYERYFLQKLTILRNKYPRHLIINMDETMIRQVQGPKRVWGMKGKNSTNFIFIFSSIIYMVYLSFYLGIGVRRINTRCGVKNGITACVSVVANGYHLPTFFIKKGTTARSLASLQMSSTEMRECNMRCTYTKKGWSTSAAMIEYLEVVIRIYSNDEPCLLIWDVHTSHKVQDVIDYAKRYDIELLLIPSGMTDIYQVCDTHINGVIKEKLASYWSEEMRKDPDHPVPLVKMMKQTTIILNEMAKDNIKQAFDETVFERAEAAMNNDHNQILLALDYIIDTIEDRDSDLNILYEEIMSHFTTYLNEEDEEVIEISVDNDNDDESEQNENEMPIEQDEEVEEDDGDNKCENDEEIAMALAGW